eukprot:TRINITY_DN21625_c0_g1_i1.p1 TRINITY_DN21625_c0_g1~~TRINITY_DN21625_c0_g1_i1.p1  ORF type:complete len:161 (-),score=39.35 TRINITY_DN21625_c0_g1_i1:5-463(-)
MGSLARAFVKDGCVIASKMDLSSSSIRLTWGGLLPHHAHMNTMFSSLQSSSTLVDVSPICATGETVRCHKIVLAAASNLLKQLFVESTGEHPVVILPHVSYSELLNIVEYIYKGEISVGQSNLDSFLLLPSIWKYLEWSILRVKIEMLVLRT